MYFLLLLLRQSANRKLAVERWGKVASSGNGGLEVELSSQASDESRLSSCLLAADSTGFKDLSLSGSLEQELGKESAGEAECGLTKDVGREGRGRGGKGRPSGVEVGGEREGEDESEGGRE